MPHEEPAALRLPRLVDGVAPQAPEEGPHLRPVRLPRDRVLLGDGEQEEAAGRPVGLDAPVPDAPVEVVGLPAGPVAADGPVALVVAAERVEAERGAEVRDPLDEARVEHPDVERAVRQLVVVERPRDGLGDRLVADVDALPAADPAPEVEALLVVDRHPLAVLGEVAPHEVAQHHAGEVHADAVLRRDRVDEAPLARCRRTGGETLVPR